MRKLIPETNAGNRKIVKPVVMKREPWKDVTVMASSFARILDFKEFIEINVNKAFVHFKNEN